MKDEALRNWIVTVLGHEPQEMALFERALTHGS